MDLSLFPSEPPTRLSCERGLPRWTSAVNGADALLNTAQWIGDLRIAALTQPATGAWPVTGDLWSVIETRFGTRMIIADALGHGPDAACLAQRVHRAWHLVAPHEPTTLGITLRLDSMLAKQNHSEKFVTALLLTVRGPGHVELVCCGHPPPLLLGRLGASWADALPSSPPLGLLNLAGGWAETTTLPFGPGDRMLMVTDGVTEGPGDDGPYYPLAERLTALGPRRDDLIEALADDLTRHTEGRTLDDLLVLLLDRH
ncbi:hypothetical protein GCM10027589_13060 [Actinocorallia lasiicapitis]